MPPPLQGSGVIAAGNDRSDVGIAPYDVLLSVPWQRKTAANAAVFLCARRPHLKISDMVSSRVLLPVELMLLQRITSWIPLRSTRPEMV